MKSDDLDSKLKSLRAPERDEEFWESFPLRVMGELRSAGAGPQNADVLRCPPRRSLGLGWVTGLALACLTFGIYLGRSQTPRALGFALLQDERELRQTVEEIPTHVRVLMQDEHGLHQLIEDQP